LVQIKSLDKKLRKLDAAMTHAKHDPSMLGAVHGYTAAGYQHCSGQSEQVDWLGTESFCRCPDDLSDAVTPRNHLSLTLYSCSGAVTAVDPLSSALFGSRPSACTKEPARTHVAACVPVNVPVQSHGHGVPIKLEFPRSPTIINHLAECNNRNLSFVVDGLTSIGRWSDDDFSFAESNMPAQHEGWE